MQLTKLGAVRSNASWAIVFNRAGNSYTICSDDGADDIWATVADNTVEQGPISLADYKYGVSYGHGSAGTAIPGGTAWDDNITYAIPEANVLIFTPTGTSNTGYVYLDNDKNYITYGVGTRTTGIVRMMKWNGGWE